MDSAISSVLAAKDTAVKSEIAVAVAAKALDAQKMAGDAAVSLLKDAAQISKAVGKGEQLDALG